VDTNGTGPLICRMEGVIAHPIKVTPTDLHLTAIKVINQEAIRAILTEVNAPLTITTTILMATIIIKDMLVETAEVLTLKNVKKKLQKIVIIKDLKRNMRDLKKNNLAQFKALNKTKEVKAEKIVKNQTLLLTIRMKNHERDIRETLENSEGGVDLVLLKKINLQTKEIKGILLMTINNMEEAVVVAVGLTIVVLLSKDTLGKIVHLFKGVVTKTSRTSASIITITLIIIRAFKAVIKTTKDINTVTTENPVITGKNNSTRICILLMVLGTPN
jgi:hypothetical protein